MTPHVGNYRWLICALLFFATTINYIDRAVLGVLESTLRETIQWTDKQYGDINAMFALAYAIGFLFAGRMMDRLGTRVGYAIALVVWSLAAAAHEFGGLVHSDAVQAFGKLEVDAAALGADLLTVSAHKLGGPKGVGALILLRDGLPLAPLLRGGGQESGYRAGTENIAAIAGFGAVCDSRAVEWGPYQRPAGPARSRSGRHRARADDLCARVRAPSQYELPRRTWHERRDRADRPRSCRRCRERRIGLLIGQGGTQPCARCDGARPS
ncbi:MAG: aminotransferase class V-fold PLP-dependent enzyme [Rhodomicrobium sp.]|nr:aminotransferase class V-fold PLP-dependent enzyme [Rhodomicrobium sp.]